MLSSSAVHSPLDIMADRLIELEHENHALVAEVNYYRSLLFSNINPTNASILNALRYAVEQLSRTRNPDESESVRRLEALCRSLEAENAALRQKLKQ